MKPQSLKEAFQMLDQPVGYLPFTAIEYLQKHPLTKELEEKIFFALSHIDSSSGTALFYAVVAEEHLSKRFIKPLVDLFTTKDVQTYEQLEEEANYLLQKLAAKYPDDVMKAVMPALEKVFYKKVEVDAFYPYLYEIFPFVNKDKYTSWFIKIIQKQFDLNDIFLKHVIYLGIPETIPHIRRVLDKNEWDPDDINMPEFEENYIKLVNGDFPKNAPTPFLQTRDKWKAYYMDAKRHKLSEEEIEALSRIPSPIYIIDKRERMDECYCGKTDKKGNKLRYKHCCFEKDAALVNLPRFTQPSVPKKVIIKSIFAP